MKTIIVFALFTLYFLKVQGQCSWDFVGSEIISTNEIISSYYEPAIDIHPLGSVFVAYSQSDFIFKLQTYNGFSWYNFVTFPGNYVSASDALLVTENELLIAVAEIDGFGQSSLKVFDVSDGVLNQVGSMVDPIIAASFNIDMQKNPTSNETYIAYCRKESLFNDVYLPNLKRFDGVDWFSVGDADFFPQTSRFISLAFDGGFPIVGWRDDNQDGAVSVMKYNGFNWSFLGTQAFAGVQVSDVDVFVGEDGLPYVIFSDASGVSIYYFDEFSWVLISQIIDFPYSKIDLDQKENGNVVFSVDQSQTSNFFEFNPTTNQVEEITPSLASSEKTSITLSSCGDIFAVYGNLDQAGFVSVSTMECSQIFGCSYEQAANYNLTTTIDDGSCVFDYCGLCECPSDLNGDDIVNTGDLILLLSNFGTICP